MHKKFTPAQVEAITYRQGPLLIIAGPGSGKTEVISSRAAHLVSSGLAKPENLLVTTFTNKAALELKDRIQKKLKNINVELMSVSTIHSFCHSLLNEFKSATLFPNGFWVLDEAAQLLFIYSHRKDLGLGDIMKGRESDFYSAVMQTYNLASEELVEPAQFAGYCEMQQKNADDDNKALWEERTHIARSYEKYLELLLESHAIDFSNLQRLAHDLLFEKEDILRQVQDRYSDVLIDEYQDTNAVQEIILSKIAEPHLNLAVVGDDDQSIYRFRGATVKNIINFEGKYKPVKVVILEDNFRSLAPIITHSSRLIQCNPRRKPKNLRCNRIDCCNDLLLVYETTAAQEAESAVSLLKRLLSDGTIKQFRDVAMLFRSVRSYAEPYIEALKENQIPYIVTNDGKFFERSDIEQICQLFAFLGASKPWGDKFVRCPIMQLSEETEDALQKFKQDLTSIESENELSNLGIVRNEDRKKVFALIELKKRVQEGKHQSILEILYELLSITDYFAHAEKEKNEEAIKNIGKLTKIINDFDIYRATTVLYPFLDYVKLLKQSYLDSFCKPPEDAIQVMTVHQAKGLEFPVVVIGAAMEGRFPTKHRRNKYEIPYDLMQSGAPEVENFHTVDERKLFYVAATRARDLLVIGTSDIVNKRGGGPSSFIRELLGNNMEAALERSRRILDTELRVEAFKEKIKEPRLRLSYSNLAYFLQCPLRFKYFVIDGLQTPRPYYLYFGTSVHRALELIHNEIIEGRKVSEEDLEKYVEQAWLPSIRAKDEEEEKLKEAASRMISTYFVAHQDTFPLLRNSEQSFAFDIEDVVIAGKIDLVRRLDGQLTEIVDFKTSESRAFNRERGDLQLNLYALGAEEGLKLSIKKCSLHFLRDDVIHTQEWNPEKKNQTRSELCGLLDRIKANEFMPRIEFCPFCDEFKDICPYFKGN